MAENIEEEKVTVESLIDNIETYIDIEFIRGKGGNKRELTKKYPNRPGILLAGYTEDFPAEAVQIMGNRDIGYLSILEEKERKEAISRLLSFSPPVIIVAWGHEPPEELKEGCEDLDIPLIKTLAPSWKVKEIVSNYMEDKFSSSVSFHGDLVDIYGVGVLITGKSGIGKSEAALDLVQKGHRLVADDLVIIKRKRDMLIGEEIEKEEVLHHNLEVRGVGILNVAALFGIKGVRMQKRVEIRVELVKWQKGEDYTRTGLETRETKILGVPILYIEVPLIPGKNISTIIEVIAMDYLSKMAGYDFARIYESELIKKLRGERKKYRRLEEDEE